MTPDQVARFTAAFEGLAAELRKMQQDPLWMARFNPVAYVALRRAERHRAPLNAAERPGIPRNAAERPETP